MLTVASKTFAVPEIVSGLCVVAPARGSSTTIAGSRSPKLAARQHGARPDEAHALDRVVLRQREDDLGPAQARADARCRASKRRRPSRCRPRGRWRACVARREQRADAARPPPSPRDLHASASSARSGDGAHPRLARAQRPHQAARATNHSSYSAAGRGRAGRGRRRPGGRLRRRYGRGGGRSERARVVGAAGEGDDECGRGEDGGDGLHDGLSCATGTSHTLLRRSATPARRAGNDPVTGSRDGEAAALRRSSDVAAEQARVLARDRQPEAAARRRFARRRPCRSDRTRAGDARARRPGPSR